MLMPRHRFSSLKESLLELSQFGSPVDLELAQEEPRCRRLEIEQSGDSRIFELENGRLGYMLEVWIANQTSRPIFPIDVDLSLPWQEGPIEWLQPCTMTFTNRKQRKNWSFEQYRFPGKAGQELPFDEVINHQLMPGRSLPPRRPISGWLLALGGLMPPHLFHGGEIEATLVVITSDNVEHPAPILFRTERLERRPKRIETRPSLFSDPVHEQKPNANKNPRVPIRAPETMNRKEMKPRASD